MEPQAWLKTLYAAMKPGGIVGIIDHAATPAATRARWSRNCTASTRRWSAPISSAPASSLEAESALLRNPADDHSLLVFDDKIRGKTDRFIFKFRKPR